MKKIFYILISLLLIYTTYAGACTDSDNGKDYFVKGTTTDGQSTYHDNCAREDGHTYGPGVQPFVKEGYCEDGEAKYIAYECPNKCENGVCREEQRVCTDSDNGKDYFVKGTTTDGQSTYHDNCAREDGHTYGPGVQPFVKEGYCEDSEAKYIAYECPNKCENGVCLEFVNSEEEIKVPEEDTESSVNCPAKSCNTLSKDCNGKDEIIIEECKVYIQTDNQCKEITTSKSKMNKNVCEVEEAEEIVECGGCQLNKESCAPIGTRVEKNSIGYYCSIEHKMLQQKNDDVGCQNTYECVSNNCQGGVCTPICTGCFDSKNVCIPFGTRTGKQYCDIDFNFKDHKSEEMGCNNDYECSTNICVNSKCISPNLIQKIISWFKNIFG